MKILVRTATALALVVGLGTGGALAQEGERAVLIAGYTYVPGQAGVFGFGTAAAVPIVINQGDALMASSFDVEPHTVTSDAIGLFDSPLIGLLGSAPVSGVSSLPPGRYPFHCKVHPLFMHGLLVVQ